MKITLRELLLLTLVVALALGWWLDRSKLTKTLKRFQVVFESHGLADDNPVQTDVFENGESDVLAVNTTGLVEISIGHDDGLKSGHVLHVVRDDKCLGQITIKSTSPDRAVGQIDPKTQRGEIQKGDRTMKSLSGR